MITNDEDQIIDRAVNKAAIETDDDFTSFGTRERIYPELDTPDVVIYASGAQHRYMYTITAAADTLGHHGCGVLPRGLDDAIVIYSIMKALKSITETSIVKTICERYGYSTTNHAKRSKRQMLVHILVTDGELVELGNLLASSEDDVLPFLAVERTGAYAALVAELRRFDVRFQATDPRHPAMLRIHAWADDAMKRAQHNGPVVSRTREMPTFEPVASAAMQTNVA